MVKHDHGETGAGMVNQNDPDLFLGRMVLPGGPADVLH
jgi:hypothetical protein